jgi:hypothetical protein
MDFNFVYMDESGDDGYPKYSSDYFVITGLYFSHEEWKSNFEYLYTKKKELKNKYPEFHVKTEFHCKEFITDKNPYHGKFTATERKEILFFYADLIKDLNCKIIAVFIDKLNINFPGYNVLEKALNYNLSRVDLDMKDKSNFLLITDAGRVDKMKSITRKIQRINFVPGTDRNEVVERMIEDPIPKSSEESFFIQAADFCSYISYLYVQRFIRKEKIANRVSKVLTDEDIIGLMRIMKPRFNEKASRDNEFGIYIHPK